MFKKKEEDGGGHTPTGNSEFSFAASMHSKHDLQEKLKLSEQSHKSTRHRQNDDQNLVAPSKFLEEKVTPVKKTAAETKERAPEPDKEDSEAEKNKQSSGEREQTNQKNKSIELI